MIICQSMDLSISVKPILIMKVRERGVVSLLKGNPGK